jgi:hypothetical protein
MTVSVTNTGTEAITLTNLLAGGPDSAEFVNAAGGNPGSPPCQIGASIAPGQECVARMEFQPNALRTFNAQLQFFESAGPGTNAQQSVALTGVGVLAAPLANLSIAALPFGNENVGGSSGSQSVELVNSGSATLNISSIGLAGANVSDFAIITTAPATTCPLGGGTLAVQANCLVSVEFAPQVAGTETASLVFTDNAAPGNQQVALSGTATMTPVLQASPASLTFAAQSQNTSSSPQTVTIANSGATPAEIGNIAVIGPNSTPSADFTASATSCTVPAGKSCQISVAFTPAATTPGMRTATLNLPTAIPSSVSLVGTATQAAISVPTSMNFGSQLAGGAGGSPQPVVVTNSSSGPYAGTLAIVSITKTGANAGDFIVASDGCTGASTSPGNTCTIQIAFKPLPSATCGASGSARSGTLSLSDNAPGSPQTIPLSGTASSFCITTSPSQPVQGPVTAGTAATYSLEVDSYAGFSGSAGLSCTVQLVSGSQEPNYVSGCSISTTPTSNPPVVQVAANSPGQFQVTVNTTTMPETTTTSSTWQGPSTKFDPGNRTWAWMPGLTLILLWAASRGSRRSVEIKLAEIGALVLVFAIMMVACGGGSTSVDPTAPVGDFSYTVVVTATLSGAGQTNVKTQFSFPLTVEQTN